MLRGFAHAYVTWQAGVHAPTRSRYGKNYDLPVVGGLPYGTLR
jgi:hypothetical protein